MSIMQKIKKTKEELLDENAQLKRIITDLPGCIYWKDKNSVYLGCNKYFLDMVGLDSADQVVGKTDYDLSWSQHAEDFKKHDKEVMLFGPASFEETATLANGKQLTYTVIKSPLYDKEGKVTGVIGTSLDISQRKKLEEELQAAKEQAETANKAKTEFIANMSHDVKTPLSGIIGISELLGSRVQEEYRDLIIDILEAGQHLMNFFDNCIELSKLESRGVTLLEENFNLKHLIKEIVYLFRPAIETKGLALQVDYPDTIPRLFWGGRVTLYRVLLNLMGNAVKFTSEGSIGIRVELGQKSYSEKTNVKLIISDTGIGIPADKQKVIFERFARLTPSYQGVYEGSGIGLYIVEEFVKSMGGEIQVKSEEGKGSQFTIIIPLKASSAIDNESKDAFDLSVMIKPDNVAKLLSRKEFNSEVNTVSDNKANILLVEDSLMAQKSTNLLLTSLGCTVDVAENGKKALALFEPGKYDLILMDIGLPDIKGYQVAERLKSMEIGTAFSVPILGLSAHATQEEKMLSAVAGMLEVLHKPLLLKQANKLLQKYVLTDAKEQENSGALQSNKVWGETTVSDKGNQQIKEAMGEWLSLLPDCRSEIENAYEARDMNLLRARLHKLHGDLCYINLPSLLQAVKTLEQRLKEGDYQEMDKLYGYILDEMKQLEKSTLS